MKVDPIARSLSLVNRIAGSDLIQKWGLYEPAQRAAHIGTREGFKAANKIARTFKNVQKMVKPERLPVDESRTIPKLFDLNASEEQNMMREMARRFGLEVLRAAAKQADESCAPPQGFAAQFAELGLAQFAVPEALGGAATGPWETTQALVYEDLANGNMGLAVAALAPIGVANALVRWGSAEQQGKYLPPLVSDAPPAAVIAVAERRPAFDPNRLKTRATQDADGFVLNGEKTLVPVLESAELFLVAADLVGKGPSLFLVEAGTDGLTVHPERCMGVRAAGLGSLKLSNLRLRPNAILGETPGAVNYEEFIDRARLAWCALALGTSQAVLEYTIEYCNERQAFGEPITNRQAVAFGIANIAIEVDAMRMLVWRAASRAEYGKTFHREAFLAHTLCQQKSMQIGTDGVQLLGGHGYTKEHPVELWYRDLMAIGVMEGGLLL